MRRQAKPTNAIADRKLRHEFALKAARYTDEVLEFYAKVMRDEQEPTTVRMEAGERLLNRAFGRVVTPIEASGETSQTVRHIHNVRWLPPDPNDRSNVIEPLPWIGDIAKTASIARIPCRFGGARPYFICPGVVNGIACRRHVIKLYGPGSYFLCRYFLCRNCYRLAHASQSESRYDRLLRRANKIRQRLGGDPGMAAPFPGKPKGMWRRTYERLVEEVFEAEMHADEAFVVQGALMMARIESRRNRSR
jgi:hypothetical protein